MGKAENKVETYLDEQVKLHGGTTRKMLPYLHVGLPDRLVILPNGVFLVEVKAPHGEHSEMQLREVKRLNKIRECAFIIYGRKGVDEFISKVVNL